MIPASPAGWRRMVWNSRGPFNGGGTRGDPGPSFIHLRRMTKALFTLRRKAQSETPVVQMWIPAFAGMTVYGLRADAVPSSHSRGSGNPLVFGPIPLANSPNEHGCSSLRVSPSRGPSFNLHLHARSRHGIRPCAGRSLAHRLEQAYPDRGPTTFRLSTASWSGIDTICRHLSAVSRRMPPLLPAETRWRAALEGRRHRAKAPLRTRFPDHGKTLSAAIRASALARLVHRHQRQTLGRTARRLARDRGQRSAPALRDDGRHRPRRLPRTACTRRGYAGPAPRRARRPGWAAVSGPEAGPGSRPAVPHSADSVRPTPWWAREAGHPLESSPGSRDARQCPTRQGGDSARRSAGGSRRACSHTSRTPAGSRSTSARNRVHSEDQLRPGQVLSPAVSRRATGAVRRRAGGGTCRPCRPRFRGVPITGFSTDAVAAHRLEVDAALVEVHARGPDPHSIREPIRPGESALR